jgi:hypothetical protein
MDKAHRGGKIVNLVAGRRSGPGLYILSGQQLFETLPPFRIEGKTWLCAPREILILLNLKDFLALFCNYY